jgi:hypothetical protein
LEIQLHIEPGQPSAVMVSVSHSFFHCVAGKGPTGERGGRGVRTQVRRQEKKICGPHPYSYVPFMSPPHTNTNQLTMSRVKLTDDVCRH